MILQLKFKIIKSESRHINITAENTEPHLPLKIFITTVHCADPDASSAYRGF